MKIAIISDQEKILNSTAKKLGKVNTERLEIYLYLHTFEMRKENFLFDLVFLDADIESENVIAFVENNKDLNFVFITNRINKIKGSFKANVYGFLEKTDSDEVFEQTLLDIIFDIVQKNYVSLKVKEGIQKFIMADIIYFQYLGHRNTAFVYRNRSYIIKGMTLKTLSEIMGDMFVYIDRDTIVNIERVIEVIDNTISLQGIN